MMKHVSLILRSGGFLILVAPLLPIISLLPASMAIGLHAHAIRLLEEVHQARKALANDL